MKIYLIKEMLGTENNWCEEIDWLLKNDDDENGVVCEGKEMETSTHEQWKK